MCCLPKQTRFLCFTLELPQCKPRFMFSAESSRHLLLAENKHKRTTQHVQLAGKSDKYELLSFYHSDQWFLTHPTLITRKSGWEWERTILSGHLHLLMKFDFLEGLLTQWEEGERVVRRRDGWVGLLTDTVRYLGVTKALGAPQHILQYTAHQTPSPNNRARWHIPLLKLIIRL